MNVIFLGCGGCSGLLSIDVLDDLRDRVASEEAVEPLLLHSYKRYHQYHIQPTTNATE